MEKLQFRGLRRYYNYCKMNIGLIFRVCIVAILSTSGLNGQHFEFEFGQETNWNNLVPDIKNTHKTIKWINVNTLEETWATNEEGVVCFGEPIGVVRSEKQ